jgi:hypothetical protein
MDIDFNLKSTATRIPNKIFSQFFEALKPGTDFSLVRKSWISSSSSRRLFYYTENLLLVVPPSSTALVPSSR